MTSVKDIQQALESLAEPGRKEQQERYFKTGKGEYGAGDHFRGVRVPLVRKVAKQYSHIGLDHVEALLHSEYHEDRQAALFILVRKFNKGDNTLRKTIYTMYLKNTRFINNWDLVDGSAGDIVGGYLADKPKNLLSTLAKSSSLWERRIAILATFYFIKHNHYEHTFKIADILMQDTEDLIHKGVGWMLREVGNRDFDAEVNFLNTRYKQMPRTMLRYAIEKFPEPTRQAYLKGRI